MYWLFAIPIVSLCFVALWIWVLADTLREERDYIWLAFLVIIPPLGVMGYVVNFFILGDEKRGFGAMRRHSRNRARIRQLGFDLTREEIVGQREELAALLVEEGMWQEALKHLDKLLDWDEENLRYQYLAAQSLAALGSVEQALAHLRFIFEEQPSYLGWRPAIDYGDLLAKSGRAEEAEKTFARIRQSIEIPEVVFKHALVLAGTSQREAAARELDTLLKQYAASPGVHVKRDRPWLRSARKLLLELGGSNQG